MRELFIKSHTETKHFHTIKEKKKLHISNRRQRIDCRTSEPNFPIGPRLGADIPHLHHGRPKSCEELRLASGEAVDDVHRGGGGGGEQDLVAGKKPALGLQIGEVVVVELVGSCRIKIDTIVVPALRAGLQKNVSVGRVQCRVGALGSVEVVQTPTEEPAP